MMIKKIPELIKKSQTNFFPLKHMVIIIGQNNDSFVESHHLMIKIYF